MAYDCSNLHLKSEDHDDFGLLVSEKAKRYAIVKELGESVSLKDRTTVLQFETHLQNGLECGGACLKYFRPQEAGWKPKDLDNEAPYSISFGPDKCVGNMLSTTSRTLHDKLTHVYTTISKPDNKLRILIDKEEKKKADFHSADDFDPPFIPSKTIANAYDKKLEDCDEKARISDPDAVKPDNWDEDAPMEIEDEKL
ncbi:Calreticulin/calnexin [Dillenia turbinata]|uniref:Calreticulin/calnexin n=1 Tax=Dillenia turbinata TaxID=194707 RepID=A0AAN8V888_9MAGN